jgi:hypothetical protein
LDTSGEESQYKVWCFRASRFSLRIDPLVLAQLRLATFLETGFRLCRTCALD